MAPVPMLSDSRHLHLLPAVLCSEVLFSARLTPTIGLSRPSQSKRNVSLYHPLHPAHDFGLLKQHRNELFLMLVSYKEHLLVREEGEVWLLLEVCQGLNLILVRVSNVFPKAPTLVYQ